ncbi:hypothetical protein [Dietzia sp. MNB45]|uniref:hypothetical protein n=1 Tax=Dietzia sp. MNB45 TaxID=3238800 RepID=UPI003F7F93D0
MGHPAFSLLIPFGVAAAVTAASCPPIERASRRLGIIDTPNERSSHTRETPRSGGIACALGVAAATIVRPPRTRGGIAARIATFALAGVGLADDKVGLPPAPRLASQIAIGALYGTAVAGRRGALIGSAVMPATVNATNFMDGINGITGATVLTWAVNHRLRHPNSPAYLTGGGMPAAAAGAALGFLPFNVPSARLFLGDSGSYLFGAAMGATLIADLTDLTDLTDPRSPGLSRVAAAHAPLLVYFADTGVTLLRRALRGENLAAAHREHVYQRIQAAGPYPHWATAISCAVTQAIASATVSNLSRRLTAHPARLTDGERYPYWISWRAPRKTTLKEPSRTTRQLHRKRSQNRIGCSNRPRF